MSFVDDLRDQLGRFGIVGARQRRIVAEIGDHLVCEPSAELGDPAALARQFADELGTVQARRAGFAAFGALAIAGTLFGAAFIAGVQGFAHRGSGTPALAVVGGLLAVLGAQFAFVAGGLAGLRAFRQRATLVVPRAEAVILSRRAAVGLLAGVAAMGGLALVAIGYRHGVARVHTTFSVIAAGLGALALLAATPSVGAAVRLRPVGDGDSGDLFDDLRGLTPPVLDGRPWRFAVAVATVLAVAIALAGVAQQDPYDGVLRGLLDGLACLGGFARLGGYLGLRPAGPT